MGNQRGARVFVFPEDFDDVPPPPPAAPEASPAPVEPTFTRAEMDAARADGFREGRTRMLAEDAQASRRSALADLAESLRAMRGEAAAATDRAAEELARLLLAALAAALPAFCRAHGDAEALAVLRLVLPGLSREPRAVIRASERTIDALSAELDGLDAEARAMLRLSPSGTMIDGDVRVAWDGGSAVRDCAAIWRDVEAALALSLPPPRAAQARPAAWTHAAKEAVDA